MRRALLPALALLGAGLAVPAGAQAEPVTVLGPSAHGVVDHGDRVPFALTGDCARTPVHLEITVPAGTLRGPGVKGCSGTAVLPSLEQVRSTGYQEGDPAQVALVAGGVRTPLRLQRAEPDQGTAAVGAVETVPATGDPFGGVSAVAMGAGDVVDLGPADLDLIESVTVRNRGADGLWELRVGTPDGRAIASGAFGAAGSFGSAGTGGWWPSVGQVQWRPAERVIGDRNLLADLTPAVGRAPHVYLATPVVAGTVLVNWVDLNGPGAAEPFAFPAEPRGAFRTLFDGSSFDGWQHTGPGRFVLRDGAMRAEHDPGDVGWAWLTYTKAQFADMNLRLRFKVEQFDDNGGVLWRHPELRGDPNGGISQADEMQIMDSLENLTGGIAHESDAERLATGLVGEWNELEIVAVGDQQSVRINGREVTRRTTTKELRRGFLSVENEFLIPTAAGHVWYDDVRVHSCGSAEDPLCAL